ncbi:MAG TPA: GNAT family N-acetyltransferase [Thermoplasmata archaeon]|nr:GNAT family N-acetyltransferase [Thermoplasmata archaeon]
MRARPDPLGIALPPAVAGPGFLRDGTELWIRPYHEVDRELVARFVRGLHPEALELRFFSAVRPSVAEEEIVAPSEPSDRLCLLALGESTDRVSLIGVGEYARVTGRSPLAEVAFLVTEEFRGEGVASLLLARLARAARAFGIRRFVARIRSGNTEMLEVFRATGLPYSEERVEDEVDVVVPVDGLGGPRARPVPRRSRRAPRGVPAAA